MSVIMVVEDDLITFRIIHATIKKLGYSVISDAIRTGRDAVEKAIEYRPDLVLMDITLADNQQMDGIQAAAAIKELGIPVIYMTASDDDETVTRAIGTQPYGYILKPINSGRLRTEIEIALDMNRVVAQLQHTLAELQAAQLQLMQQERLRALATMAAGVAHDFSNAITGPLAITELCLFHPETLDDKERMLEYMHRMNRSLRDATETVMQLRRFSRERDTYEIFETFQSLDLSQLVEDIVLQLMEEMIPLRLKTMDMNVSIDIITKFASDIVITANEHELRQVVINLCFNAVDALPFGGIITIRTYRDGGRAVLEVSDPGAGMTPEVRKQCLEPHFTTKGEGGSGLGLAMVYGIVQRHEGSLNIDSEPDRGTIVTISLPLGLDLQIQSTAGIDMISRSLHVLVADEKEDVVDALRQYLIADGHSVITSLNGRDALEKFLGNRFDVVITGRSMPEMTGQQLLAAIHRNAPQKPIIMMTGSAARVDDIPVVILPKPVTISALREALVEALGG